MANYYSRNYTSAFRTKPEGKYAPGEYDGSPKVIVDRFTLTDGAGVGLNANDEIEVGLLPPNSMVIDAKVYINKSLGATGIFSLGHRATTLEGDVAQAADADAFVVAADAGGQAALGVPTSASVGLYKRFKAATSVYLLCTEVMDDSVIDGVVTVEIKYINK